MDDSDRTTSDQQYIREEADVYRSGYLNFAFAMFKKLAGDMDTRTPSVNEYLSAVALDEQSKMMKILEMIGQKEAYIAHRDSELTDIFEYIQPDLIRIIKDYVKSKPGGKEGADYRVINGCKVYSPSPIKFLEAYGQSDGTFRDHANILGVGIDAIRSYRNRHPQWMNAITGGEE